MAVEVRLRPAASCTAGPGERRRRPFPGRRLDLSTRLNRYGPPEAVRRVRRSVASDLTGASAPAAERLAARYAELLGVDQTELVVGRGASELLVAVARQVPDEAVAVPLPASVDVLAAFPGRGFPASDGDPMGSIEQVDAALDGAALVVISNPMDPAGRLLDPGRLCEVAASHPASTLVVDESGVEFLSSPEAASVIGADVDNVIAVRSAGDFYGMGAACAGVVWCRDPLRLRRLLDGPVRPPSALDAMATEAALVSTVWAVAARRRLADDAAWLGRALQPLGARVPDNGVAAHYRCVVCDRPEELAARFAVSGVSVAVFGAEQGLGPGAIRVAAPRSVERPILVAAVEALSSAHAGSAA